MRRPLLLIFFGLGLGACGPAAPGLEPHLVPVLWTDGGGMAPDGGTDDAGEPDAGEPDAGEPDAGELDAGLLDGGGSDAGLFDAGLSDAGHSDAGWWAKLLSSAPLLAPNDAGCLVPSGLVLDGGATLEVLAMSADFVLVDELGRCVSRALATELSRPIPLPPGPRPGLVQVATRRSAYGANGCPHEVADIAETTPVDALAKSHDRNYRGYAVVGRDLSLAPVRTVDAPGWNFPWLSGVQLVKQVPQGYVTGAGVVIGPNAILTAKHMGVDATYCYSREARTGAAWAAGQFDCTNIAGPAINEPSGVDAAIVTLKTPLGPPYAKLRTTSVQVNEAFFSSRWGTLLRNVFADSTVLSVGSSNANCAAWPASSSFISKDLIVAGGDSGGPAWSGDEVIGIVHGEKCKYFWEPSQHVFVNVPSLHNFVAPYLPP